MIHLRFVETAKPGKRVFVFNAICGGFSDALATVVTRDRVTSLEYMRVHGMCDAPLGSYLGLPWRVRDVSRLCACHGHGPAVRTAALKTMGDHGFRAHRVVAVIHLISIVPVRPSQR